MDDGEASRQNDLPNEDSDDDLLSEIGSFGGFIAKPVDFARNKSTEQSINALSKIFDTCRKSKEKETKLEETRLKIEGLKLLQDQKSHGTTESTVNTENPSEHDQLLGKLALEEIKILHTHRGERVLRSEHRFQLFNSTQLTPRGYREPKKAQNDLKDVLSGKEIEEIVKFGTLQSHFRRRTFDREVVYLFRLLTVHSDPLFIRSCWMQLCQLLTKCPSYANCITLRDILIVLVNCGADLNRLLPNDEIRNSITDISFKNQLIDSIGSVAMDIEASFDRHTLCNLFEPLLNVILVVLGSSDPWDSDRLMVLVVIFCSLALDVNFVDSPLVTNLANAISFTASKFDESGWFSRISQLSRHICNLTDDHHNLSFLIVLFPSDKRMDKLKRVTAFRAGNKVLGIELGDLDDVSPQEVLEFLHSRSLKEGDVDFYLWHSVLNMIDCCVSSNPGDVSSCLLEELVLVMKKLTSTFKENLRCPDAIKVKDLATRITSKWSAMKSVGPISQRTMFSYLISEKPSFIDSSSAIAEDNADENKENESLHFTLMES